MTERLPAGRETLYQPTRSELVRLACESAGLDPDGTLKLLAGGCHNDVYAYEAPNGKLVMRSPKDMDGMATIRADYDLLLELDGRRAPRPIRLADVAGTPVALVEFIEGVHKDDFNSLIPSEIEELAEAMAEFHAKTSARFSDRSGTRPTRTGTHADYLWAMVREGVTDRLQPHDDLSDYPGAARLFDVGLRRLEEILTAHPDEFAGTTFSRLHHDLNPGNIIWKQDGSVAFIDANPTYGDICDDVNYVVSNNGGSAEFQYKLLTAYTRAAPDSLISPARMGAYTLKNWLDDLAWTIDMCEKYKDDPELYEKYRTAYFIRAEALERVLG